ncbi:MAG: histidine kinase [endosymbiont of Galathealinum brachiosum]|uniref:Chemotaxis protein CheA n=1 Tax=endosymbiont of Galathealinum brachiosum TaxID=2200906 RepID=A0A370DEB4_9GAMM|nr:MAG: histidine kinase [endosymbiont of Galathealinum brachiosum]
MKTEDTVEYNSLRWVKKELDLILQEAQASLSAYIEDTDEEDRLRESVEHLHMVQGTLQMVELYGAAQLAEEMEKVSEALLNGNIDKVEDAYDVLMRSMLQLPDYLESLQSGRKDVPMVLLPLLNDLRASRSASLLSENVLFFPDVNTESGQSETEIEAGQLVTNAKKLRPHFQIGLLGWFKGQKVSASLKRLLAVLGELEKKTAQPSIRRIWSISSALVEGLGKNGIDSNVSIKMLLGQVDRSIKQLIDTDEDVFAKNTPNDLLKNLLYYVARITTDSPRVKEIKTTYRLEELLPGDNELEEARSGMGGLNAELLETVSAGIREDLLEVKDALEIFVHSEVQDLGRLGNLPALLNKIADTLSMLGLGMPREMVLEQHDVIEQIISKSKEATDELIMGVAGVLLAVESQLNSFIANRSSMGGENEPAHRVGDLADMPESEYLEVLSAVIREALQDFNDARLAILNYLENPVDKNLLEIVLQRLEEIDGAMFMLPIQKLKHQTDSLRNYVSKVMLNAGQVPEASVQNDLADVVTSIEYYLEAILEGRPDLELSMNSGNAAADRLLEIASESGVEVAEQEAVSEEIIAEETEVAEEVVSNEVIETEDPVEEPVAEKEEPALEESIAVIEEPVQEADEVEEERYIILSDDADEEILEIFIEEAMEELASLNEQIPVWERDHGNQESLSTIRRSFHTLKGSGRLIGAELIGEFSWNFENMLNRVIDKSRPLNQDVFDILHESLGVLPQLIEQLKGNREPIPNIYKLIDRTEALGKWKKPEANKVAASASEIIKEKLVEEVETPVSEIEELQFEEAEVDETETIEISEDEVMDEISDDELVLEESPDEVADESVVDNELSEDLDDDFGDEFDIDLTDELEALQIASSDEADAVLELEETSIEEDEVLELEEVSIDETLNEVVIDDLALDEAEEIKIEDELSSEDTLQIYIDPVLFDIFKGESENHLQQIKSLLDKHNQSIEPLTANAELLRALHTLFGSARTAEVDEIAELCGGLEKYVRLYLNKDDLSISDTGVTLISDVASKVSGMLAALEQKNHKLESDDILLSRINSLSIKKQNELATEDVAAVDDTDTSEDITLEIEDNKISVEESLVSYSDVDDELVEIFLEEAEELLDSCENSLQRWNSNNNDEESVQDLQRHLHTLKGGARMADLSPVGDLTHALESLVIAVNDKHLSFTKEISNAFHDALDQLSDMLSKVKERQPLSSGNALILHIDALREGKKTSNNVEPSSTDEGEDPEPARGLDSVTIDDTEDADTFAVELTEEAILSDDFDVGLDEDFGFEIPLDPDIDSPSEDEGIVLDSDADYQVELSSESILEETEDLTDQVSVSLIDEIEEEEEVESTPEETVEEGETPTFVLEKNEALQENVKPQQKDSIATEQVRVRSDLLNDLVNHAGEVSVYHARMGQQISNFSFNLSEMNQTVIRLREQLRQLSIETEAQILSRYEKESDQYDEDFDPLEMDRFSTMQQISRSLQETVGDIESIKDLLSEEVRDSETLLLQESRVSSELQEGLMRTRMVHFGGLASRLRRIVRQTARELDKEVELEIVGETSEVDRTVLDRIVAPLEHMLRNAVSHGIENVDERKAAGKQGTGTLRIIVDREGSDVVITVDDDGRGIDVNAIRKKATDKGLLTADSVISDHDVLQYIMEAGFSTAEKVTQISGRGVGMDVVDSEIKQLGGVLEIDTVQGKGTTFKIRLPLTLAINHALLVNVGEDIYAVPLNSIEGVVRLSGPELQQFYNSGENSYEFAGSSYELKHLGALLTGEQADYSRQGQLFPVLLARTGDQSVALHVDDLIGRREVVVKPVGAQISTVRGISGATILGDGRVVIILEMNSLVLGDSLFHVTDSDDELGEEVEAIPVIEEKRETIVMVVDDSITIRKVTERMLTRHDMKVITAKDGVDAVSQLQEVKPDVMLLDIEMPRMDGYEVATHVRNDPRLADLPIIMITSRSGSKHKDKAMEIGVNKYMGKPFQEDELLENIHELID